MYKVIYELLDDVKKELTTLLKPKIVENSLGKLTIKGIFKTTKTQAICGGEVTEGKMTLPALAHINREGEELAEVKIINLKRGPQDAREVVEGEMCGISFETINKLDLQIGDQVECFTRETLARSL